jgi:hypothetical protein
MSGRDYRSLPACSIFFGNSPFAARSLRLPDTAHRRYPRCSKTVVHCINLIE